MDFKKFECGFDHNCWPEDDTETQISSRSFFEKFQPKPKRWHKTPRTPADFYDSNPSSILSVEFSGEAEEELDDYFSISDKSTEITNEDIKFDWSSKYWGVRDGRRHWELAKSSKEILLFPSIYPVLDLRSRYGRYCFQVYNACAVPESGYKKKIQQVFATNLQEFNERNFQINDFILCDTLANLSWFDKITRSVVVRALCQFLRQQKELEKINFENAQFLKDEGLTLLCALGKNNGSIIKELHIWRMFAPGQNPVLTDCFSLNGRQLHSNFPDWSVLAIFNYFGNLTSLSINYGYLANENGDALLNWKCVQNGNLKEIRILCLKAERPYRTNPGYGVGGWIIKDGVWRRVKQLCPNLQAKFVFLNIPQYENIILFLSKSIPMNYVYISSGIDFYFEQTWDVDSTLLELRNWYSGTLETLCLHLWHHRDLLDFVIKAKLLDEFPNLIAFEFIGILEDTETLETFCQDLSKGKYKLKTLLFWVEEIYTNSRKVEETQRAVLEIQEKYKHAFQNLNIDADIRTYAM